MRRILSFALALLAAFGMAGLALWYRAQEAKVVGYTLGMGVAGGFSAEAGEASQSFTVAAVILDGDGKVVDCTIDCADSKISFEGGEVTAGGAYLTKGEMGDSYGMAQYSPIGKEWYEQAAYFANYVRGIDLEGIKAIAVGENGKAVDGDILAGCTVAVPDFKEAVIRALECKNATEFSSAGIPSLSLGFAISDWGTVGATGEENGKAAFSTTVAAVSYVDGRVLCALIDVAAPEASFDKDGVVISSSYNGTKGELGDSYGMAQYSPIGKEWYEQAAHFCKSISGLTVEEASKTGVAENGKAENADILAGCTITVSDFVKAVSKALEKAE